MFVKGVKSVLGIRGHDFGIEVGWMAGSDGRVCGE